MDEHSPSGQLWSLLDFCYLPTRIRNHIQAKSRLQLSQILDSSHSHLVSLGHSSCATLLFCMCGHFPEACSPPELPGTLFPLCDATWLLSILPVWMPLVKAFAAKEIKHQLQHWKCSGAGAGRELGSSCSEICVCQS